MTSLADFQRAFLKAYQADDMAELQPFLSSQTPASRLAIYRNSITGGLIKSLGETYAVCRALVGDEFFNALAQRYMHEEHSTSPDLGDYGATFPDFVETFEHTQSIPYLADMCRLAWAYHLAARHPGDTPFDSKAFSKLTADEHASAKLITPSSAQIITSPYPLLAIWRLCMDGGDETIELQANETHYFIVWRQQVNMRIDVMTAEEQQVFSRLHPAISMTTLSDLQLDLGINTLLSSFIERGWVADFMLPPQD